jgi:hypothetical protein
MRNQIHIISIHPMDIYENWKPFMHRISPFNCRYRSLSTNRQLTSLSGYKNFKKKSHQKHTRRRLTTLKLKSLYLHCLLARQCLKSHIRLYSSLSGQAGILQNFHAILNWVSTLAKFFWKSKIHHTHRNLRNNKQFR